MNQLVLKAKPEMNRGVKFEDYLKSYYTRNVIQSIEELTRGQA